MKRTTLGVIGMIAIAGLAICPAFGSIVQDNFDRADNGTLGTASDGVNTWGQSQPWSKYSISGNTLQVSAGAQPWSDAGNAYIGELAAYPTFTETFKFNLGSSTGGDSWLKIAPCGGSGGNQVSYPGWLFRRGSGSTVNLTYFDGSEAGGAGNVCQTDTWTDITITVTGNTSTIKIGDTTYTTPAGMGLARPQSDEHFRVDFTSVYQQGILANFDDLIIAVPEPATLGVLALGSWVGIRRRK